MYVLIDFIYSTLFYWGSQGFFLIILNQRKNQHKNIKTLLSIVKTILRKVFFIMKKKFT
jgi:hypothetical protein